MKASETIVGQWYRYKGTNCYRVPSNPSDFNLWTRFLRVVDGCVVGLHAGKIDDKDGFTYLPDCTGYDWTPPAPEPVYMPFANAAEFAPFRERWILNCGRYHVVRVYDDKTVNSVPYSNAFEMWTFEDGTPFGILESKDAAS